MTNIALSYMSPMRGERGGCGVSAKKLFTDPDPDQEQGVLLEDIAVVVGYGKYVVQ
jgi:hypothetical protein